MRKLSARWVPHLLSPDNKRNRETTSEQCLTLFKRNPREFLRRFVIVDETWIHMGTHQRPRNSLNSGLHPANLLRKRRRLSHRTLGQRVDFSTKINVRFFKFGTYDSVDAHKNISKFQTDLTTPSLAARMR